MSRQRCVLALVHSEAFTFRDIFTTIPRCWKSPITAVGAHIREETQESLAALLMIGRIQV